MNGDDSNSTSWATPIFQLGALGLNDATAAYQANQQAGAYTAAAQANAAAAVAQPSILTTLTGGSSKGLIMIIGLGVVALFIINQSNK